MGEKVTEYAVAFLTVNGYVQEVGDDPSLVFDSEWIQKTAFAFGVLNFRADEMAQLEPSPKYVDFHPIIVDLADETHLFTDAFAKGIDNVDSALINQATQHLINMTVLMQDALTEMDRIKATP